jgi:hypothetical protein
MISWLGEGDVPSPSLNVRFSTNFYSEESIAQRLGLLR